MWYNWLIKNRPLVLGFLGVFVIGMILIYIFQKHPVASSIYNFFIYWAAPLSTAIVLIIGYMAYILIAENRRIRAEDKELEAERHRREEVKGWIDEILIVKAECSSMAGSHEEWRSRIIRAKVLVAKEDHIIDVANRIDITPENKTEMANHIGRLSEMLRKYEGSSLSAPSYQEEIQKLCNELLDIITK